MLETKEKNAVLSFIRKNSVSGLTKTALESVLNGDKNALEVFQAFKLFADTFADLNKNKQFRYYVMSEAARHITVHHSEQKPAIANGFKMFFRTTTETDFSECNDEVLADLEEMIKERKAYLKRLEEPYELNGKYIQPARTFTKEILVCTKRKAA